MTAIALHSPRTRTSSGAARRAGTRAGRPNPPAVLTPSAKVVREQPALSAQDRACVAALRRGDEAAFAQLVDRYHGQLLRLAASFVRDRAVAEEVVQETWIGVIRGIERFEGRASLKTWIFRILTNTAKKHGVREHRSVPFSALTPSGEGDDGGPDADRFVPEGHLWAGHWTAPPESWGSAPMERLLAKESRNLITRAIAQLPDVQRQVITLRDVEGWSAEEVCDVLKISDGNQRVLLHRGRSKIREILDDYMTGQAI